MALEIFDSSNVHVDVPLTNFAVAWGSNAFIADRLFPTVQVPKDSGLYPVFGKENYLTGDDVQGDKGPPKERERTFEMRTFQTERHALTEFIPDSWRTNADDAVASALEDTAVVGSLKEGVLLNREVAVMTLLATSGSYASGLYENMDSVANRNFDDASGPGALKTLLTFKNTVKQKCGQKPNIMVVSDDCWVHLSSDSAFFGGGAVNIALTPEALATILKLDAVIVAEAQYSSSKPKAGGEVTLTDLWPSNSIWMTHSPPGVTKFQPSIGKLFKWNATGGYVNGELVRTLRDERSGDGGTWIEYKQHYDARLTALDSSSKIVSGCWLQNVYIAI